MLNTNFEIVNVPLPHASVLTLTFDCELEFLRQERPLHSAVLKV